MYRCFCLVSLCLFSLSTPSLAQETTQDKGVRYRECMAVSRTAPSAGVDAALAWQGVGGGHAADHCLASSLFFMGHYARAADRFEKVAQEVRQSAAFKAEVLSQAANAWFLAEDSARAYGVMSAAIGLNDQKAAYYVDRARFQDALGAQAEAITDLTHALGLDENYGEALIYRASLYRQQEAVEAVFQDVSKALALDPSASLGYLERGMIYRLQGKDAAARQDWVMVLESTDAETVRTVAQRNLELLDLDQE